VGPQRRELGSRARSEELGQLWLGPLGRQSGVKVLESSGVKSTGGSPAVLRLRGKRQSASLLTTGFVHPRGESEGEGAAAPNQPINGKAGATGASEKGMVQQRFVPLWFGN